MRPIKLKMRAFGPYPDTEVIDFRELGDHSLFLVSGATGAGKSAILDGICFALFGTASGSERTARAFRSHHAQPSTPTAVELLFQLKSVAYRVERGPEQERPKQRGEGTTTEKPYALLYEVIGAQETLIADGTKEVNQALETRLGYGPEQFRQLVVLPQGEFRTLVTAKSGDREKVFSRLFDTQRYAELGKQLSEEFKAIKVDLDGHEKTRRALLTHVGAESEAVLLENIKTQEATISASKDVAESRRSLANTARDKLEEGRVSARALAAAKEAEAALAEINTKAAVIDAQRNELARAKHAATVDDVLKHRATRRQELTTARRDLDLANSTAIVTEKEHAEAKEALATQEAASDTRASAQERVSQLKRVAAESSDYEEAQQRLKHQGRTVKQQEDHLKQQQQALADARTLETQQRALAADAEQASQAVETLAALVTSLKRLKAEVVGLAESLQSGEPCPVCGSEDHPNPARADDRLEDPDISEKQRQLDAARAAAKQRPSIQENLERISERATSLEREVHQHQEQLAQSREGLAALHNQVQNLEGKVPENLRAEGAIPAAIAAAELELLTLNTALNTARTAHVDSLGKHTQALAKVEAMEQRATLAASRLREAESELVKRIREAGFEDEHGLQEAQRSSSQRQHLETSIADWTQALAATTDRVEQTQKASKGLTAPNIEALTETHRTASDAALQAENLVAEQRKTLDTLQQAARQIEDMAKTQATQRARYTVLGRLAHLANGKGSQRVTFERFVQAEILESVLVSANERLHTMSSGRYQLRRATGGQDRRRTTGLDLDVMDSHTGAARPVSTLSGGEGFEAALALALGLADIIQAQYGGIQLDTIFVDEGFGSLGEQDLDAVITALQSLQAGGRLVGLISHVPEVKARIGARLDVLKGRDGSTTRFVVP